MYLIVHSCGDEAEADTPGGARLAAATLLHEDNNGEGHVFVREASGLRRTIGFQSRDKVWGICAGASEGVRTG